MKNKIQQTRPEQVNCSGCQAFCEYDGEMTCMNQICWHGGTPVQPECYEYAPDFLEVIDQYQELVETLGIDHPETNKILMLVIDLAPEPIKVQMRRKASELGLLPRAAGYLDDGTPVFGIEDVAVHLGATSEEVQVALEHMLADRAADGLPNAAMLADPASINRMH